MNQPKDSAMEPGTQLRFFKPLAPKPPVPLIHYTGTIKRVNTSIHCGRCGGASYTDVDLTWSCSVCARPVPGPAA